MLNLILLQSIFDLFRLLHGPHVPAGLAGAVRHEQPNEWQLVEADHFYGVGDNVHIGPRLNIRRRPGR